MDAWAAGGGKLVLFYHQTITPLLYTKKVMEKVYEPRARLPVRPGGLSRRRLDGALPVSY